MSDTAVDPATPAAPDLRRERATRIVEDVRGAIGTLRCSGTGRLVRQGISMTHMHLLWLLVEHGEQPMSRLAELLDTSVSSATGIIDRMEERGLVERVRVPDDRRIVLVRPAPEGLRILEDTQIMKDDLIQAIVGRLDDAQLDDLERTIVALRTALEAELAAGGVEFAELGGHGHDHPHSHHPDHHQHVAGRWVGHPEEQTT